MPSFRTHFHLFLTLATCYKEIDSESIVSKLIRRHALSYVQNTISVSPTDPSCSSSSASESESSKSELISSESTTGFVSFDDVGWGKDGWEVRGAYD